MTGSTCGPDLSVLIVTYNSAHHVDACLHAVRRTVTVDHEVVAIDNASSDGTVQLIRDRHPDVALIDMGSNTGFSRANNRGVQVARGRHLVLLNPDTEVRQGALDRLVAFLDAHPGVGVVAPRLLNPDGSDQGTARAFPTPAAGLFGRRSPLTRLWPSNPWSRRFLVGSARQGLEPFEVDWVSGACLMMPAAVASEVGGLDDGFFMHFEDADLCHRIKDSGYEVWCDPGAQVVHAEGGCRRGWPPAQLLHFHRGALRYYVKHRLVGRRRVLTPAVGALLYGRCAVLVALSFLRRDGPTSAGEPASTTAVTTI